MRLQSTPQHIAVAAGLIGQPWLPERNCWWLVREWFKRLGGPELPDIDVGEDTSDNVANIVRVCSSGGLRPVSGAPLPLDIALVRSPASGSRHVGVLLVADGQLQMLHNEGGVDHEASARSGVIKARGAGVVLEPLAEALRRYHGLELWRRES